VHRHPTAAYVASLLVSAAHPRVQSHDDRVGRSAIAVEAVRLVLFLLISACLPPRRHLFHVLQIISHEEVVTMAKVCARYVVHLEQKKRLVLIYFLSQNIIYSTSPILFMRSAERRAGWAFFAGFSSLPTAGLTRHVEAPAEHPNILVSIAARTHLTYPQ